MPHPVQLERVRFYAGKLLTAADLEQEQAYHLARSRRHNRFLHGWGVVTGLRVALNTPTSIIVEPGLAIDCAGNELVVAEPVSLSLGNMSGKHFVLVRYVEQPVAPQPACGEATEFGRVREAATVELSTTNPTAGHRFMGPGTPGCGQQHPLCLATLAQRGSRWRLDAVRWTWMKRYRLWDAVRKIFLHPENWLQPERRDDQSLSASSRDEKATSHSSEPWR